MLKTEQIKLEHKIRLVELKARQAKPGEAREQTVKSRSILAKRVIWLFRRKDLKK